MRLDSRLSPNHFLYLKFKIGLKNLFPIIHWLPQYRKKYLFYDFITSLTITSILIPQCLVCAQLSQVPIEYGLTSCFLGLLVYMFLGSFAPVHVGPTAVLALVIGKLVLQISDDTYSPIIVAATLSFYSGIIVLILGVSQLGAWLDLLPDPMILGFFNGAALNVFVSMLPNFFGVKIPPGQSSPVVVYLVLSKLSTANWKDILIGVFSILTILILNLIVWIGIKYQWKCKKFLNILKILINTIAIVCFTLIVFIAQANRTEDIGVNTLKTIPQRLVTAFPNMSPTLFNKIGFRLVPLILTMTMEHIALVRGLSRRLNGIPISSTQEMVALGTANLVNSFLGGFPITGSTSKSAVQLASGVKSPLSNIFTASFVLIIIYFLTPILYYIPKATLSAMIMLAVLSVFDSPNFYYTILKCSWSDFCIFFGTFLATFFGDSEIGLYFSIILITIKLLWSLSRPYLTVHEPNYYMNNSPASGKPRSILKSSKTDNILIFQPKTNWIFLNAQWSGDWMLDYILQHTRIDEGGDTYSRQLFRRAQTLKELKFTAADFDEGNLRVLKGIILDFSHVQIIDYTGIRRLFDLKHQLNCLHPGVQVILHFAHVNPQVLPALMNSGLIEMNALNQSGIQFNSVASNKVYQMESYSSMPERKHYSRGSLIHKDVSSALENLFKPIQEVEECETSYRGQIYPI